MAGMALLGWAHFAPAQEIAKLPYEQLYQVQKVQGELTRTYTNLHVALRMQSTDLKVKSSDLDVFIDSKKGRMPVKIDADGSFSIPMRSDLEEENPPIITNQPRGSMQLDWKVGMNASRMTNVMSYRFLMQPVKDCSAVQERMREVFPSAPKLKMVGLKLIYDRIKKVSLVTVSSKSGDKKLQADEGGEILIPLEPSLLEENPTVTLQQMPAKVEIVTKRSDD